jgi:hypothetical protein
MMEATVSGKVVEVKKIVGGAAGPSVKIVVEDRNGSRSDIWIFAQDLSAFNEIKEPE